VPQPCHSLRRVSPSFQLSAFAFPCPLPTPFKRLTRSHHTHTHTHTHTLSLSVCVSLSLSLSPAGGRAVNTRHSTSAFRSIGRSWIRAHFGSTAFNRLPYSNLRADIPSVIKCPLFSPFPPVSRRSLHRYIALRPPSTSDSASCL